MTLHCATVCDEISTISFYMHLTKLDVTQSSVIASSVTYNEIRQNFSKSVVLTEQEPDTLLPLLLLCGVHEGGGVEQVNSVHPQFRSKHTSQKLGTQQLFSFATTTTPQLNKVKKNQKNVKVSMSKRSSQNKYCNNKQLCGLKTWSRCRGNIVACPALHILI